MDVGGAALAPNAAAGIEHVGRFFDERTLLLRGQLDHSPGFVGRAERGENFAFDAKIRMVHVLGFDSPGKSEGHLAEFVGGHGVSYFGWYMVWKSGVIAGFGGALWLG